MHKVTTPTLEIAYLDEGPRDGPVVVLLHGFPYDVRAYDAVSAALTAQGFRCLIPYLRGYGPTRFLRAETLRSGQQAALAQDLLDFLDALGLERVFLGGFDWGGRAACIVAALHPDRVRGLVSCGDGYNIQNIARAGQPADPAEETRYWYMYYFHTERGRRALEDNRDAFCKFIWSHWSPSWAFDAATFQASATSFHNPDFVDIVMHSYVHRFGTLAGDPAYDAIETALAHQPKIAVPTIVLQGADDTIDPPTRDDPAKGQFTGPYARHVIPETGHNVPQEAPEAFASAILDLARDERQYGL